MPARSIAKFLRLVPIVILPIFRCIDNKWKQALLFEERYRCISIWAISMTRVPWPSFKNLLPVQGAAWSLLAICWFALWISDKHLMSVCVYVCHMVMCVSRSVGVGGVDAVSGTWQHSMITIIRLRQLWLQAWPAHSPASSKHWPLVVALFTPNYSPTASSLLAFSIIRLLLSKAQGRKKSLKTILTRSCWYSLDSSRWALSDEYLCARVSVIMQVFSIILYCPN